MISSRRLLLLIAAFALVVGVTLAQGPKKDVGANLPLPAAPVPIDKPADKDKDGNKIPQMPSLSIDVDVVNVDVIVTDNSGNEVGGLTKSNFKVFDDNVEQTITNFSPTDMPLTVVILVEFGETFGYFADNVVRPAAGFINSLRQNDWGALVAYDIRPEILTDFTKDKSQLFQGLQRLRMPAYRETCLYDAVWDTLDRLDNVDGKKAIFLLSTGLDTISKHSYPDLLKRARATGYDDLSGQHGTYRIATMMEGRMGGMESITFLQADNVLRSLAEVTGGTAFYPKFIGEYPSIYNTVSTYLRNQYSLGFVPTNRKADGKFHKLRMSKVPPARYRAISGKTCTKLKVNAKQGYYAPKS